MAQLAPQAASYTPPVITAAIKAKAQDNIRKAKVQLVLHQPFFASIVLRRSITISDQVPTAYVTPSGHIVVGTGFVGTLTVAETVGLLAHEAMHYAMLHHVRVGHRNKRAANVAMDKVINDILTHSGLTLPKDGIFEDGARAYAWEELYVEPTDDGSGGGKPYTPGDGGDDLGDGAQPDAEQIEEIKRELIQARQAAKAQGKMPAGMDGIIDDMVNPKTPWYNHLRRYFEMVIKADLSWKRPNRKVMAAIGMYLPSAGEEPRMGTIVIQMDESGSIGREELEHFSGHINKIIEDCRPEKVYVLHTSSEVAKVEEFGEDDFPIKFKSYTTGGTDMEAGIRWVNEQGIEPDVFVCLTDGYTTFNADQAPTFPVVWLITSDVVATYGDTIHYEVTE